MNIPDNDTNGGDGVNLGVNRAAQAFKKPLGNKKEERLQSWRKTFLERIEESGLQREDDKSSSAHYIMLHAPWPVLCRLAEELNLRAPLQMYPTRPVNWSQSLLSSLCIPNPMVNKVPHHPPDYYTCPFRTTKLDKFLGGDDPDTFFSRPQRSRMVWEVLCTTIFGNEKKGEVGICRLLEENGFAAAFPLHDGQFDLPKDGSTAPVLNRRQVLHQYWARWGCWFKYQPLDHIREYFGERIAIYFAWLGFYTGWLLPAALVGFAVFLYGIATLDENVIAQEVCHEQARNITMCPLCSKCSTYPLHQICAYTKVAYLFDHPGTVFYAVFMSFWAVTFLEYWKRKNASLAHQWDCMGFQEEDEKPRPEFAANAPYLEENPITGVREPSFPKEVRLRRIAAGSGLILLMVCLVLVCILAVIIYRTVASIELFKHNATRSIAPILASTTGAMINLMAIMTMGKLYERLAFRLTTWEMHRTQSEFDDNLTFKVFIFQFINFYSSLIYVAFFKGKFTGYPGHYKHIVGNLRNEECGAGGCLIELAQQLGVIMVGKQCINNAQEIIIPKVKAWWHQKKLEEGGQTESQTESDYRLVGNEGLFQEYLEMVLQFGFITIFVAAFPLPPLFALLNNWVEIRLDAQKFVCETRRAVAERAENIGIWFKILEMLAKLAVISNAFLIAFTSDFIQKLVYKFEYGGGEMDGYVMFTLTKAPAENWVNEGRPDCYYRGFRDEEGNLTPVHWYILTLKFAFVIIFEHFVFGICKLIDIMVPDIPYTLDIKIKRERYLAKQALQESEHIKSEQDQNSQDV